MERWELVCQRWQRAFFRKTTRETIVCCQAFVRKATEERPFDERSKSKRQEHEELEK
jgi:hypothetical protein